MRWRRLVKNLRTAHWHWWLVWFRPAEMFFKNLGDPPEKLRWGNIWGPVVDRGRQTCGDLRLI
jgi:hypothetical protein